MKLQNSPVQKISFQNKTFFIKRDDLLDSDFNGNKARKLYYFLINDFPNIKKIISYGSMQSNAMFSLSVLAKIKNKEFIYCTRINEKLLQNPTGNLKRALENRMKIKDIKYLDEILGEDRNYFSQAKVINGSLIVPEGGRCKEAEFGIKILADEIRKWAKESKKDKLKIFLPSGTGATALYLQKNLPEFEVLTTPCVGDSEYLKEEFFALENNEKFHPKILTTKRKYRFANTYNDLFGLWQELKKDTKIEFDLIYDPVGFKAVLENNLLDENLLYIHQGGINGNESMLQRYSISE